MSFLMNITETFEMDYGETADIEVGNEDNNIKENPHIVIEKTTENCYNIMYGNEHGYCYVKKA